MTKTSAFWRWNAASAWAFALIMAVANLGLGTVLTLAGVVASPLAFVGGLVFLGIGLAIARRLYSIRPVIDLDAPPGELSFVAFGRPVTLSADEIELVHPIYDNPFLPFGGQSYGGVHGIMIRTRIRTRLGPVIYVTTVPNRDALLMRADASGLNVEFADLLV